MAEYRRYVAASLEDEVYTTLMRMATVYGKHPSKLIEDYVIRGLLMDGEVDGAEGREVSSDLRVYMAYQRVRMQETTRLMLRKIAAALLANPDEGSAEELSSLCQASGITVEEVMKEAQESALVVGSPISFGEETGLTEAKVFLMELFRTQPEIDVNQIYARAKEKKIGIAALKAAKNSLRIVAIRRSHYWVWAQQQSYIPASIEVRDL